MLISSVAPRAARGKTLLVDVKTVHCSRFTDINADIMDAMYTLGPLMSQDPILLAKIVRIGRSFFKDYYSTGSNSLQQDSPTIVRMKYVTYIYSSFLFLELLFMCLTYFVALSCMGKILYCILINSSLFVGCPIQEVHHSVI